MFRKVVYALNFFPGFVLKIGASVPSRYLALFCIIYIRKCSRSSFLFFVAAFLYAIFVPVGFLFFKREASLLDFSYFLAFIYLFLFLCVIESKVSLFRQYMVLFTGVNLAYAFVQLLLLNFGVDSSLLLMHENIKSSSYFIPPSGNFFPVSYRVTGLFHESAPYNVFLFFSYCYFSVLKERRLCCLILVSIFLGGAKVGYLFLLYVVLSPLIRFRIILPVLIFILIFVIFYRDVQLYAYENFNGTILGSIYLRLDLLLNLSEFVSSWESLLFGLGVSPSSATLSDKENGLDFFSIFIKGNGFLGSIFILAPIGVFISKAFKCLKVTYANLYFVAMVLALLVVGALTVMQYAIFFGALCVHLNSHRVSLSSSAVWRRG